MARLIDIYAHKCILLIGLIILSFALSCTDDPTGVKVNNSPPFAVACNDTSVTVGDTILLKDVGSYDSDGELVRFEWMYPGDTLYTPTYKTVTTVVAPSISGEYFYILKVTDADGAVAFDTVLVTVKSENKLPIAIAGIDTTVEAGSSIILKEMGSHDSDGEIVLFEWLYPGDSLFKPIYKSIHSVLAPKEIGTYHYILKVTDNSGGVGYDTVEVTTTEKSTIAPIIFTSIDTLAYIDDSITLVIDSVYNPDDALTKLFWFIEEVGRYEVTIDSTLRIPTPEDVKYYNVIAIAEDSQGNRAEDTTVVRVGYAPFEKSVIVRLPEGVKPGSLPYTCRLQGTDYSIEVMPNQFAQFSISEDALWSDAIDMDSVGDSLIFTYMREVIATVPSTYEDKSIDSLAFQFDASNITVTQSGILPNGYGITTMKSLSSSSVIHDYRYELKSGSEDYSYLVHTEGGTADIYAWAEVEEVGKTDTLILTSASPLSNYQLVVQSLSPILNIETEFSTLFYQKTKGVCHIDWDVSFLDTVSDTYKESVTYTIKASNDTLFTSFNEFEVIGKTDYELTIGEVATVDDVVYVQVTATSADSQIELKTDVLSLKVVDINLIYPSDTLYTSFFRPIIDTEYILFESMDGTYCYPRLEIWDGDTLMYTDTNFTFSSFNTYNNLFACVGPKIEAYLHANRTYNMKLLLPIGENWNLLGYLPLHIQFYRKGIASISDFLSVVEKYNSFELNTFFNAPSPFPDRDYTLEYEKDNQRLIYTERNSTYGSDWYFVDYIEVDLQTFKARYSSEDEFNVPLSDEELLHRLKKVDMNLHDIQNEDIDNIHMLYTLITAIYDIYGSPNE